MDIFSEILKINFFPKKCVFVLRFVLRKITVSHLNAKFGTSPRLNPTAYNDDLDLEKLRPPSKKSLVQHPGRTVPPATVKIGMHPPEGVPYGYFFGNLKIKFFPPKIAFFADLYLEKLRLPNTKFCTSPRPNPTAYNDEIWHAPSLRHSLCGYFRKFSK